MDRKERAEKAFGQGLPICQQCLAPYPESQVALPDPHHWVTDTFAGTGECVFDLCDSAYDAVSRGLNQSPLSPEIVDKLDKHFPSILSNWKNHQTVRICIHAELRVILHLGPPPLDPAVHPIGVSKLTCFCCVLWIESHNRIFGTQCMTSGSHGKPYANWTLPSAVCLYAIGTDGRSSVDEAVLKAVWTRLTDTLAWLFPGQKRIFDEHFSSGDESSGNEQGESKWRRKMATLARPPRG